MPENKDNNKITPIWRAILEVGFIVFLFYSNLLMGEFTHSGLRQSNGLWWAIKNVFTKVDFLIAVILAMVGYSFFEFFRKRF
jgi:uncharacterized protein with PQ loop repeat